MASGFVYIFGSTFRLGVLVCGGSPLLLEGGPGTSTLLAALYCPPVRVPLSVDAPPPTGFGVYVPPPADGLASGRDFRGDLMSVMGGRRVVDERCEVM